MAQSPKAYSRGCAEALQPPITTKRCTNAFYIHVPPASNRPILGIPATAIPLHLLLTAPEPHSAPDLMSHF